MSKFISFKNAPIKTEKSEKKLRESKNCKFQRFKTKIVDRKGCAKRPKSLITE